MAKATIENALIDRIAKREGRPLHELLGYRRRPIPSGISIGIKETNEELIDAVGEAVATGYHRVKMKIKRGRDIEMVSAVRERFPDLPLMVDANGDYSLQDAEHLRQLDRFNLTMIEQPLSYSDIYEHSILQRELATPLCLDESIHDLADARTAIALGSCRIINIKQGRVGGLLEALRIADFAVRTTSRSGRAAWTRQASAGR
jgi:o-succinylbenzoate synthase